MNVLSLFNGMSVCNMALEDVGINVDKMYISEIDKYANQASEVLFPDQIQLGSVCDWYEWDIDWSSIDLVTGGFPCQAWSMAGKQLGDKDERGMLFWTMLDIMSMVRMCNPDADFIIENVKMKREFEEYITHHTRQALGNVHKVLINSALVSAQNRNRYYWTSFEVGQPEDEGIVLADILEDGEADRGKSHCIDANYFKGGNLKSYFEKHRRQLVFSSIRSAAERGRGWEVRKDEKANCLLSDGHQSRWLADQGVKYRKLTPRECMRLQTIPEHHIDALLDSGISNTQLYKMTGNGWTMKVISHILRGLK